VVSASVWTMGTPVSRGPAVTTDASSCLRTTDLGIRAARPPVARADSRRTTFRGAGILRSDSASDQRR
jgi:hypothetical protein